VFITDKVSQRRFLVDTGAEVSVIKCTTVLLYVYKNNTTACKNSTALFAANGSPMNTFGSSRLKLDLGLRREFTWNFIVADSEYNILGADFCTLSIL